MGKVFVKLLQPPISINEQTVLEHKQLNLENNVCFNDLLDSNITPQLDDQLTGDQQGI